MELKPYYDSDDADSIDLSNAHDEDICEELMDDVEIQMPPPRVKIEKPNLDVLESRIIECAVDVHESVFTVLYALHEHFARCNTYTKEDKMNEML
jgi:hypothetical protein